MLRHALRIFLLNFLLLPIGWAANTVALVLSDSSAPYIEFAGAFSSTLEGSNWKVGSSGKIDSLENAARPDLIVTAGSEAFRLALARPGTTPIIATLIARPVYEKILADSGKPRSRHSAVFIEQSPARQLAFLRLLLPGRTRIGMLGSSESRALQAPFRLAIHNAGYTLDTEDADTEAMLLPAANALLPRVHLLLAVHDPSVYKRDNIKAILVTSYRHQKPVVAFSAAFVNAGALAALHSTPQQAARQAGEMLLAHGSALPAPEYPNQFSIAINRSVADALNLQIPDEADLRRALMAGKEPR